MKTFLFIAPSFFTRALAALALGLALMGLHGSAMALTTEHGTICKPYGNSNTAGLYASIYGVANYSGAGLAVICPVVRTVTVPAGSSFSVWVDGSAAASDTTYCSLYSTNYDGSYLGAASFSATGAFSRLLTLPDTQVPYYSSQSVYCYVPNNGNLYDIEPNQ